MTDKAKRRRKELAERLGISRRSAANLIAKKTADVRAAKVRSPIDSLLDGVVMHCTICGASSCDCWVRCACGWSFEKGEECHNPVHRTG